MKIVNIAKSLEQSTQLFSDTTAIICEDHHVSYHDLNELSNRIANGLMSLGVKPQERVALFLPNIPFFIAASFAILKIGAVIVTIESSLKAEETKFILNDSKTKVVITTETLRAHIPTVDLPALTHLLIAEGAITDEWGRLTHPWRE